MRHFDVERSSVHLSYWVIMINKSKRFPFLKTLQRKHGVIKSACAMYPTGQFVMSTFLRRVFFLSQITKLN